MAKYSEEFKYSIMTKMMPPHNQAVSVISRETGLSEATLHQWRRKARAKVIAPRSKGLYVEQVHSWRDACMQANGGVALEASRLQKDKREMGRQIKTLEYELRRKESALAETAALLVLKKKSMRFWGTARDA